MRGYRKWKAFTKKAKKILEKNPHVIDVVISYLGYRTFLGHEETLAILDSDLTQPVQEIMRSMDLSPHELHFRLHRIKYIKMDKDTITFQPKMPLILELDNDGFKVDKDLLGVHKLTVTVDGPITISGRMKVQTDDGNIIERPFVIEKYMMDELKDFMMQLDVTNQNIQIESEDRL